MKFNRNTKGKKIVKDDNLSPKEKEEKVKKIIAEYENELDAYGCVGNSDIKLSASFGYYIKKYNHSLTLRTCIKRADEAMYENKLIYHSKENG